ncbi:MAG: hypothetical protein ORN23_07190 [Chthoniobacterales bacterium]|nr:hypothetical protein [Chthoniobacterales bacterium]
MPVIITASVSKKVGQANYGSAGFSLTVQSEVSNLNQVAEASHQLYTLLNDSVNAELNGDKEPEKRAEWPKLERNTSTHQNSSNGVSPIWRCSDKQKALIGKLIADHHLEREDVEKLSLELFGTAHLHTLHKMQASGLIDRLIEEHGGKNKRGTTPANWRGK